MKLKNLIREGGLQAPEKFERKFVGEKHGRRHRESSNGIHCGPTKENLQRENNDSVREHAVYTFYILHF